MARWSRISALAALVLATGVPADEGGFLNLPKSAKGDICLLHGTMKDKFPDVLAPAKVDKSGERKALPLGSVWSESAKSSGEASYMIRLRFLVKTAEACKQVAEAYCRERDKDGFIPKEMKANYRKQGAEKPLSFFRILPNCAVVPDPKGALTPDGSASL